MVTKEPTTQETGEKTYTCTVCEAKKIEILDKLSSGGSSGGGGGTTVQPDDDEEDVDLSLIHIWLVKKGGIL